jgi:putative ABC transport system substrate-binding protein
MDPEERGFFNLWQAIETLIFGTQTIALNAGNATDIGRVLEGFAKTGERGLLVLPTPHQLGATGANFHLGDAAPATHDLSVRLACEARRTTAYGIDAIDLFKRAGHYVSRILTGEKPGELPLQQPAKFELVVNLKIAKAIGLATPSSFLARADEVIE